MAEESSKIPAQKTGEITDKLRTNADYLEGMGGGWRSGMTVADYLGFLTAPRFHNGARGALKPDERYAVLQTDEGGLSRREASSRRQSGSRKRGHRHPS
jgi:hypothetical protein